MMNIKDKYKINCPNCNTLMDYQSKTCIFCFRKHQKETKKGRSNVSKAKIKIYKEKWFQDNKERIKQRINENKENNINLKNEAYFYNMKDRYGLSKNEILLMYDLSNNCCQICGIHYSEQTCKKNKLNIDHCHVTGQIRGLLCHNCNIGLGNFKDNIGNLKNAINYLKNE